MVRTTVTLISRNLAFVSNIECQHLVLENREIICSGWEEQAAGGFTYFIPGSKIRAIIQALLLLLLLLSCI